MRILLAAMFLAPIAGFAVLKIGSQSITPSLIAFAIVAIGAQLLSERRERRA